MLNNSPLLYQTQAIKELEKIAVAEYWISSETLMQRAGQATLRILRETYPEVNNIIVLCGKGNNAGDGYVVAKCAHEAGLKVKVLHLAALTELQGAAYDAAFACHNCGVVIRPFLPDELKGENGEKVDVIVDALLGTGFHGPLLPNYREAIDAINVTQLPIVAVDLPSGLYADTGAAMTMLDGEVADFHVVRAALTVTFIGLKSGLVTGAAKEFCGKIICDDLDLPEEIFLRVKASGVMLNLSNSLTHLSPRPRYAHKGNFGHVLVVGGDFGMGGAVRMAAEAAARTGAGLVSVATRKEHITAINAARPEIMCHGVATVQDLAPLLNKATCVVIGPGLGTAAWGQMLWQEVLGNNNLPLIIDADALNLLAATPTLNQNRKIVPANWILTPHPGEAARLLNITTVAVQNNRYDAVTQLQQRYGGVVILKGAGSLVKGTAEAENEPTRDGNLIYVCPYGNPGMASGGMGDILSGILGGLLAQKLDVAKVAQLGVCLHSKAADLAVEKAGGERGLLALDLLPYLQSLLR